MNLESQLNTFKTESRGLPLAQRAELACRLAKEFEKFGEYEKAREALGDCVATTRFMIVKRSPRT
jgi:hypothetical protein